MSSREDGRHRDWQDRLVAVATVDANIIEFGHWYFSAGVEYRGAPAASRAADIGTNIRLFELAVTREPASVTLPAIEVLDGTSSAFLLCVSTISRVIGSGPYGLQLGSQLFDRQSQVRQLAGDDLCVFPGHSLAR